MSKKLVYQLLLILAGVFIGIIIYFSPRQKSQEEAIANHQEENHNHDDHLHETSAIQLNQSEQQIIDSLLKRIEVIADKETKLTTYDSLIAFCIQIKQPPLVAKYAEKKAAFVPTSNNWILAGDNYFKAFRFGEMSDKELIEGAIRNYNKALEIDTANFAALTSLGVAYVEGASILGEMPMKGIGILLDVVNKDPKNVDALTNLGYFAIQSGQYDKAIARFETVLEIDSTNAEAYIYLTDTYLSQGNVDLGIETLEKYKALIEDPLIIQQVDNYIKELKNK